MYVLPDGQGNVCRYACIHAHIHRYIQVIHFVHTYIRTYIHTVYTYIHTHIYIHKYNFSNLNIVQVQWRFYCIIHSYMNLHFPHLVMNKSSS